jgi:hypothetical protein
MNKTRENVHRPPHGKRGVDRKMSAHETYKGARATRRRDNKPENNDHVEFGMIVAKGCEPCVLHEFFQEFSYELIDEQTLRGMIDERVVAQKYAGASTMTILRHTHVDLALMEDEWTSFSRVGTPVTLFYVELMSPLPASPNAMRLGKEHQFANNQPT